MSAHPITRVAVIGLGRMGTPMAARLVAHGFTVRVFDARADTMQSFVRSHGGSAARSVADAVACAEAAIAMLPDDAAVKSVMLGPEGMLGALPAGGIAIDMGTSSPSSTRHIARAFAERPNVHYVDAPVMGGVPFARDGTLDIMAGGAPQAVERCLALFAALGRRTYRCGASGAGHALKALANFLNAATFAAALEALVTGKKFGLDTELMVQALSAMCTGRQHPIEKKIVPHVLSRRFATGMSLGLIAKDLGVATGLAGDLGARCSMAERTRSVWQEAVQRYGFDADQAELVRLWEDDDAVELRARSTEGELPCPKS